MTASSHSLRLPAPGEAAPLPEAVHRTVSDSGAVEGRVRLVLTAGSGHAPRLWIEISAGRPYPEEVYASGVTVEYAEGRRSARDPLCRHKTLSGAAGAAARDAARERGHFDALWLNDRDRIAESTIANVFLVEGRALRTPPLEEGLLPGIVRGVLLARAREAGLEAVETPIGPADLAAADEVLLANSLLEVAPVVATPEGRVGPGRPGPWSGALRRLYVSAVGTLILLATLTRPADGQEVPRPELEVEEGLGAASEAARQRAVRRIRHLPPESRPALLERAAGDPSSAVRVEAVELHFDLDADGAIAFWRPRLAREPAPVRRCYLARLGALDGLAQVPELVAGLEDPSSAVREAAHAGLVRRTGLDLGTDAPRWRDWWGVHRDLPPRSILLDALGDDSAANRLAAVRSIGELEDDADVFPLLLDALADPASSVRTEALRRLEDRALREFGIDPDLGPDRTERSRKAAWDWWLANQGRTPRERLREALSSPEAKARGRAILQLSASPDPGAIDLAVDGLGDPSSAVRARAAEALRALAGIDLGFDPDATPPERKAAAARWAAWASSRGPSRRGWLLDALRHEDAKVRATAAHSLGESGDPSVVADLVDLLEDEAGGVRFRAIRAIERLIGERLDYDPDATPEERARAADAVRRRVR